MNGSWLWLHMLYGRAQASIMQIAIFDRSMALGRWTFSVAGHFERMVTPNRQAGFRLAGEGTLEASKMHICSGSELQP